MENHALCKKKYLVSVDDVANGLACNCFCYAIADTANL